MCGEEAVEKPTVQSGIGSPPHVRGRVADQLTTRELSGITPACAGKRLGNEDILKPPSDHPRMCGEEAKIFRALCGPMGSPPHVRGRVESKLPC